MRYIVLEPPMREYTSCLVCGSEVKAMKTIRFLNKINPTSFTFDLCEECLKNLQKEIQNNFK